MAGEVETAEAVGAAATSGLGGRLGRYGRGYAADAWRYVGYSFGTGLVFGFLQVLLGLYVLAVGHRESFLATQQLVVALCSAGFSVLAGVLVDRLGAKTPLLLSAGLTVLGLVLLVADPREVVILGASAVLGAGVGFYWVSQGPVLAQVAGPERRAGLFGLNWMFFTASGFAGGLMAGTLPALLGPLTGAEPDGAAAYRYTMWLGALALAGTAVPLLGMRLRRGTAAARMASGSWWRIERPRMVAILLIPIAAAALAIGFTVPFLSIFLKGMHGASTGEIGLILGLFALVGSLGGVLGPALSRRWGPVRTVSALLLAGAPVLLLVGYAPGLGLATAALWTRGLLANAAWPVALAHLIASVSEGQRGRVSALMNISFELSLSVAALPAGLLMERIDYRLPYPLAAAALVVGGGGFLLASRKTGDAQ